MIPLLDVVVAGEYNAFYVAGFAMAFALAARELNRSGAPAAAALALLAAAGIGGIIGSRLLFFDLAPHGPGEKTVLGGLVGGTLAFLAARTLLRVERASTDALAVALPIGMAVGRIGCFLAGCCFGRPTGAAWGVRYGPGTEPFAAQLAAGLIGPAATATVAVHPVQLYEAGLDVLLALALWRCRGRFRRRGSAFLAFLAGYAVLRVGVEAFRFGGADVSASRSRPGPPRRPPRPRRCVAVAASRRSARRRRSPWCCSRRRRIRCCRTRPAVRATGPWAAAAWPVPTRRRVAAIDATPSAPRRSATRSG
ncbi:MAG TPA: prolipoprotein diacylglyceryl transferase family protein [Longimicrobiales bacterium]